MSLVTAAKYPFISEAKRYVRTMGDRVNDYIIEKASERVRKAFENRLAVLPKSFIEKKDVAEEEILTYAIAKIMIAVIGDPYIRAKYSIGEAKRAFAYLSKEDKPVVDTVSRELGIEFSRAEDGKSYLVHFIPFIRNQPGSPEYLLINRNIKNGYVTVSEGEKNRLLEEAIRRHVERVVKPKNVPEKMIATAEHLKKTLPRPVKKHERIGDTPPCIEHLMKEIYEHRNVPHIGRVYLTMYLNRIGWKKDGIIELFSNLPDFNIRITEYQVEYITSHNYNVPNCSTIRSYGLCVADCGIKNPMQYRKTVQHRKDVEGGGTKRLTKT